MHLRRKEPTNTRTMPADYRRVRFPWVQWRPRSNDMEFKDSFV